MYTWIVLSEITTNHQIGSDTSKTAAQWCVYNVKVWWKTERRNNFKIQLARQKAIGPSVANVTEVTFRLISFVCNLDRSKSLCAEQVGFFLLRPFRIANRSKDMILHIHVNWFISNGR